MNTKWKKAIWAVPGILPSLIEQMIVYWPGPAGNCFRRFYYKMRLAHLGEKAKIDYGVHIINPSMIWIGDNTHIDRYVTLAAGKIAEKNRKICRKDNPAFVHQAGEIHIGSNVHIAPYAYLAGTGGIQIGDCAGIASGARIYSLSNHYCNLDNPQDKTLYAFSNTVPPERQLIILGPVVMGSNTALGLNAVMLPGSTIGENSWAGVLSCVVGTIPADSIASGCPAKPIKNRLHNPPNDSSGTES